MPSVAVKPWAAAVPAAVNARRTAPASPSGELIALDEQHPCPRRLAPKIPRHLPQGVTGRAGETESFGFRMVEAGVSVTEAARTLKISRSAAYATLAG
jgi:hypothetical protein